MNLYHCPPPTSGYGAALQLLELAKQYQNDCQDRIDIVTEECLAVCSSLDDDDAKDFRDQIGHWTVTRDTARKVISGCKQLL